MELLSKVERKVAGAAPIKPLWYAAKTPILTISFDDVPRSAVTSGARRLEAYGVRGTFYVASSLMGGEEQGLPTFTQDDLETLVDGGHEIGCHTADHVSVQDMSATQVHDQVRRNADALLPHVGDHNLQSFSYPLGMASVAAKRAVASCFSSARGISPGSHRAMIDAAQLRAERLYSSRHGVADIAAMIRAAHESTAWLVLYTHDVADEPSPYGCTPELLECALQTAASLNMPVLTTKAALAAAVWGTDPEALPVPAAS